MGQDFRAGFRASSLCSPSRAVIDPLLPEVILGNQDNFVKEWIDASKGDLKTSCNFDYGGKMIEQLLLGMVAYRVGKKLAYDAATGRVTTSAEGNDLLRRKYRSARRAGEGESPDEPSER